ncbi:hypothetical protein [Sphingobium abikonense]|uniref:hypothetical protein n=1 Tax=Sphingobium abikonense TaxID=86193 RepID=UPI000B2FB9F3|nr:hypothetical protein [Sphingobium abikonense]
MVSQRKKLSLKLGEDEAEEPSILQPAAESEHESSSARYHPSHDPELVTDDEIPW